MATRTIEEYVDEIISHVDNADFDNMASVCETLEKMRYNTKVRYRHNYWRVMQCLGEVASDRLVSFLLKLEKTSCKCHMNVNFRHFLRLFVEVMCNVKVIKRTMTQISQIAPVLFRAVRQTDDLLLTLLGQEAIHKLIIVGRTEAVEYFMKYGLMKDLYQQIKLKCDLGHYSIAAVSTMLFNSKLILTLSVWGSENIRRQVKRSGAVMILAEYMAQSPDKAKDFGIDKLYENFSELKKLLGDEKEAEEKRKIWKPKLKLQVEQEQDQLYLFCSSPNCRKIYSESRKGFRYCGACRLARYCSEACQKEHWKAGHRDSCQHSEHNNVE